MTNRTYDIVVWGCTGFTGELVAEYFARDVCPKHPELKWALAGRTKAKVEAIKASLAHQFPGAISQENPAILIGTADDQDSVDAIVGQTKVLLTTAGPYLTRGTPVVDACVRLQTDYVDITGETTWVADMIDRYHNEAEKTSTFIVPMSGYDSIPSDLGALFAVEAVREKFGQPTRMVKTIAEFNGQLSGGTLATGIEMGRDFPEHRVRSLDPFCMGGGTIPRPEDADQVDGIYDEDLQVWTEPWQMQSINTRVVRRSNAWLHYGSDFVYQETGLAKDEATAKKNGAKAKKQKEFAAQSWQMMDKMRQDGKLPKQGEGPSREVRAQSWFDHKVLAEAADGRKLVCTVSGGDPGYVETAKMIAESALCLLYQKDQLLRKGGVLTPAAAGGMVLLKRLQDAGIIFSFDRVLTRTDTPVASAAKSRL